MLHAIDDLLAQPVLLLAILSVGAGIGIAIEKLFASFERDRRRAYWAGRNAAKGQRSGRSATEPEARAADFAADQLKKVMAAKFRGRALLNKPEAKVFRVLDGEMIAHNRDWQVMAQVSLGEFMASDDPAAYSCINAKRVDFALMDPAYRVRHVLEYQGSGHHLAGGGAAARDAIKKEAVRQAGIGYHEIAAGHTTPAELRALIRRLVPARPPEGPPPPDPARDPQLDSQPA